jgi:hypothetical protein
MEAISPPYEKSVFINCPFDPAFAELLHAIAFTVLAFGLVPRSARESEGLAETRIERVIEGLASSKYSIHDLSRFTGEGSDNFARFNMPLELGMAIALRHERRGTEKTHNWRVLVPRGYAYQRFVSDLAGFDPSMHETTVISVISAVAGWLKLQEDVVKPVPTARKVLMAFPEFRQHLDELRQDAFDVISWPDILVAGSQTVPRL